MTATRAFPRLALLSRHRTGIALSAIIVFGILLRLPPLRAGLPYITYVDEGHVLQPVMRMMEQRSWDPGWYRYPSLLMTLSFLVLQSVDFLRGAAGKPLLARMIPHEHGDLYDLIGPPGLIVAVRCIVLAHSAGLIVLSYCLARLLAGAPSGLAAATLTAALPALATRGGFVMVDPLASFYFVAAVSCGCILVTRWSLSAALLGGFCAGLACTAKYQAGISFVSVLVGILLCHDGNLRRTVTRLIGSGLSLMASIVAGMPALIGNFPAVRSDVTAQLAIYKIKSSPVGYWTALVQEQEAGWIVTLLACAGLIGICTVKSTRRHALVILPPLLVYVLLLSRFDYQPLRNMLPVIGMLCIAAGVLPGLLGPKPAFVRAAVTAVILLGLLRSGTRSYDIQARKRVVVDSRVSAMRWLADNRHDGENIYVARELAVLPSELTPPDTTRISPEPELVKQIESGVPGLYAVGSGANLARMPAQKFGTIPTPPHGGFWRTNRQAISLYRVED